MNDERASATRIVFGLGGDVTLADFSEAMTALRELLDVLAEEVAPDTSIDWLLEDITIGDTKTGTLCYAKGERPCSGHATIGYTDED